MFCICRYDNSYFTWVCAINVMTGSFIAQKPLQSSYRFGRQTLRKHPHLGYFCDFSSRKAHFTGLLIYHIKLQFLFIFVLNPTAPCLIKCFESYGKNITMENCLIKDLGSGQSGFHIISHVQCWLYLEIMEPLHKSYLLSLKETILSPVLEYNKYLRLSLFLNSVK